MLFRLCLGVVLLLVDVLAKPVLLAIDLSLFLAGELAAVGCAIVADLFVNLRLFVLEIRGLLRSQRSIFHARCDAALLALLAALNSALLLVGKSRSHASRQNHRCQYNSKHLFHLILVLLSPHQNLCQKVSRGGAD